MRLGPTRGSPSRIERSGLGPGPHDHPNPLDARIATERRHFTRWFSRFGTGNFG